MSTQTSNERQSFFSLIKLSLSGQQQDYTVGSLRKAVFLLSLPMIIEMGMEAIFSVVDIFFVGRIGNSGAVPTVFLTESVLTIVYSVAIGVSMAATAMVARRIGEKNPVAASNAGVQAAILCLMFTVIISIAGLFLGKQILELMGGSPEVISTGVNYTRIVFGGSIVIMLLHLLNGIFRGSGDASMAMYSLGFANLCNIILCPTLIYGIGPIPAMGVTGAGIATTIGRGLGVLFQLYFLFKGNRIIKFNRVHLKPDWQIIKSLFKVAMTGIGQFLIGSASWMALARIMSTFGDNAVTGYGVAVRVFLFFLLPAWGMSNAAAALVGQNLGAKQPERAEQSVWKTAKYNSIFMVFCTLIFLLFSDQIVRFMNKDVLAEVYAVQALRIISLGYIFYGIGMVIMNAFNGAGDTKTPTLINVFVFWLLQIPLAYLLAITLHMGPKGVFITILVSETVVTIVSIIIFYKGNWKKVKI